MQAKGSSRPSLPVMKKNRRISTVLILVCWLGFICYTQQNVYCDQATDDETILRSLALLCRDEWPTNRLRLIESSQLIRMAEYMSNLKEYRALALCPSKIARDAIEALRNLVLFEAEDVCTLEKANLIRDFVLRFVNPAAKSDEKLPNQLLNYFLGYGFKVSRMCKKNMINNLIVDTKKHLSDDDFAKINWWINAEQNVMRELIDQTNDFDDLLLASDIEILSRDFHPENPESDASNELEQDNDSGKIFIQTATGAKLKDIQVTCERRFRPLYERLILPHVILSNVGLDYRGEDLERELSEMRNNRDIQTWYKVVYLCESLKDVELVGSKDEAEAANELGGTSVVKIVTKEEARQLAEKEGENSLTGSRSVDDYASITSFSYEPEIGMKIENLILDPLDKPLLKLIINFNSNKTQKDRIQSRVIRKVAALFKESIKSGKLKLLGNFFSFFKGSKIEDASKTSSESTKSPAEENREEVVKAVDDYVRKLESPEEGSVSGLGGITKRTYRQFVYVKRYGVNSRNYGVDYAKLRLYGYRTIALLVFISGILAVCFG